jgi:MFS superfamily sulfate permease-like transporter
LYLWGDMANHACLPTARWLHEGSRLLLIANVELVAGAEVTISYLPPTMAPEQRAAALALYGFVCACAACAG